MSLEKWTPSTDCLVQSQLSWRVLLPPAEGQPAFRDLLLSLFPTASPATEFGQFALRLLGYLLFPTFHDKRQATLIVLPREGWRPLRINPATDDLVPTDGSAGSPHKS